MDIPTKNLGQYVRDKGINIMNMSRMTGIPYGALYDSLLNVKKKRDLRLGEALAVCAFLNVDPLDFAEKCSSGVEGGYENERHNANVI